MSVQAEPGDLEAWLALARRLEAAGFAALLMGDHPGSGASPWPALGCAAAVTRTLGLGTYVVQAGVREPMHVAADAATLSLLAPGRVLLGIGAGHTPREWADIGRQRPSPAARAGRLAEFAEAVAALLAGSTVTLDGRYLALHEARLDGSLAGAAPVRLVIGGGHPELLRAAARRADVVGLAGLGRTLPDGHQHEVRWSAAELRGQLDLIRAEADQAGRSGRPPALEALVQVVRVTGDRDAALAEVGAEIPSASAEDLAQTPFLLIGSHEQMAAQLRRQAAELGITGYVVREGAVPDLERVLAVLRG
ncbi:MAG TPA: LLM class flavin-dependent oxidoreductase [Streptosporangiaceae bacterium]|nr:LLM class flavin-dependent oxidoreductase [Streptosporangiaceae bacterium]